MVSSCLQDKVQTPWQDTQVFYALALSCFSPDLQDSASSSTLCGRMLTCSHIVNGPFAFWEGQEEDGRRERGHRLFSLGSLPLLFHNGVIPQIHTDWALPCSYSTHRVLVIFCFISSTRPMDHNDRGCSCFQASFTIPFGSPLTQLTPLWTIY